MIIPIETADFNPIKAGGQMTLIISSYFFELGQR